jgi:hypothetical protein
MAIAGLGAADDRIVVDDEGARWLLACRRAALRRSVARGWHIGRARTPRFESRASMRDRWV